MEKPLVFEYPIEINRQDHGGTPSAEVTIDFSFEDNFGQKSLPTRGEFVKPAPAKLSQPTLAASLGLLYCTVAPSTAEVSHYEWKIEKYNGSWAEISGSPFIGGTTYIRPAIIGGQYRVSARAVDAFGNEGAWSDPSSAVTVPSLILQELSSDPDDPDEGEIAMWMSDGTGTGDDGDILVKITAGDVTKTTTLVDFSEI